MEVRLGYKLNPCNESALYQALASVAQVVVPCELSLVSGDTCAHCRQQSMNGSVTVSYKHSAPTRIKWSITSSLLKPYSTQHTLMSLNVSTPAEPNISTVNSTQNPLNLTLSSSTIGTVLPWQGWPAKGWPHSTPTNSRRVLSWQGSRAAGRCTTTCKHTMRPWTNIPCHASHTGAHPHIRGQGCRTAARNTPDTLTVTM